MDRLFVYRTIPVTKFQFKSNSKIKTIALNQISKSERGHSENEDGTILFKTRKNILL